MIATLAQESVRGLTPTHWPTHAMSWLGWLLLALAIVMAVRLAIMYLRYEQHRTRPIRIFLYVAQTMGVSLMDQYHLWSLARAEGLASPLTLLVSRGTLEHHALGYARRCKGARATAAERRYEDIRRRLFE